MSCSTSDSSASLGRPANSGVAASACCAAAPIARGSGSGISSMSASSSSVDSTGIGLVRRVVGRLDLDHEARAIEVVLVGIDVAHRARARPRPGQPELAGGLLVVDRDDVDAGLLSSRGRASGNSSLRLTASSAAPCGSARSAGSSCAHASADCCGVEPGCSRRRLRDRRADARRRSERRGGVADRASAGPVWRSAATFGFSCSAGLFSAMPPARVGPGPICSFIVASRRSASSCFGSICRIELADRDRLDEEAVLRVALGASARTPRSRPCGCRAGDRSRPRAWPTARRAARAARARGRPRARACACRRRLPPRPPRAVLGRPWPSSDATITAGAGTAATARRASRRRTRAAICAVTGPRANGAPSSRVTGTTPRSELVTNTSSAAAQLAHGSARARAPRCRPRRTSASTRARTMPGSTPRSAGGVTTVAAGDDEQVARRALDDVRRRHRAGPPRRRRRAARQLARDHVIEVRERLVPALPALAAAASRRPRARAPPAAAAAARR